MTCPATGGMHVWTDDVDERHRDRRSMFYLRPRQRWHCDECATSLRPSADAVTPPYGQTE